MKYAYLLVLSVLAACGGGDGTTDGFQVDVSGLQGDLTLSNFGSDPLKISKTGSIDFPKAWTKDSKFKLRIEDEPCAQRCTLSEKEGTLDKTKLISVKCTAKAWEIPTINQPIAASNLDQYSPVLAMNKYGDILLTWKEALTSTNTQLTRANFTDGTWILPEPSKKYFSFSDDTLQPNTISVAFNDQGEGDIAWAQKVSKSGTLTNQIYHAEYSSEQWRLPAADQNFDTSYFGHRVTNIYPIVKSNNSGTKIMVWAQEVPGTNSLFYSIFRKGSWSSPDLIDPVRNNSSVIIPHTVDNTSIALNINELGQAIVGWAESDSSKSQIFVSVFDGTVWSASKNISTNTTTYGNVYPRVAIGLAGRLYVSWTTDLTTPYLAKSNLGDSNWNITALPYSFFIKGPDISINNKGNALLAYVAGKPSSSDVNAINLDLDGNMSAPTQLQHSIVDVSPIVKIDDYQNALVTWNTSEGVYIHSSVAGTWDITGPKKLNSSTTTYNDVPSIAANSCQKAVAWQQLDKNGKKQIYVARYY